MNEPLNKPLDTTAAPSPRTRLRTSPTAAPLGHPAVLRKVAHTLVTMAMLAPLAAWADCKVSPVEVPITMVGSRAVATLGINGTQVPMTVDSGAFYSVLTDAAAEQLDLPTRPAPWGLHVMGLAGPVKTRLTKVKQLKMLDGEVPNVEFLVGGNEPGAGTLGLLGRNILSITDAEYDLGQGAFRFMFPKGDCKNRSMAYWADDAVVSQVDVLPDNSRGRSELKVMVSLNGQEVPALLDTGAGSLVSLAAAKRAGLTEADMTPAGEAYGAGRGRVKQWTAAFQTLSIGGEKIDHPRRRGVDYDVGEHEMILGIDFFLSHRIYVSKAQRRVYITYNGGPVFALSDRASNSTDAVTAAEEPQDAAGFARRGAARAARQDHAGALKDLDRACELAPQMADYFVQRGLSHKALRHALQARQDFDTALSLNPRQADALWERALLRTALRDRAGAQGDLQALDGVLAPQSHQRMAMAQLYSRLHQQDKALAQLNLWIPAHLGEEYLAEALNQRCWARALLGIELTEALQDCDKAVDHSPKNANFLDSRGWVQLRRGKPGEALDDYERALQIKPDIAWALYGRGLARLQLGHAEAGHADLAAARRLQPSIDAETQRYGLAPAAQGTATP